MTNAEAVFPDNSTVSPVKLTKAQEHQRKGIEREIEARRILVRIVLLTFLENLHAKSIRLRNRIKGRCSETLRKVEMDFLTVNHNAVK